MASWSDFATLSVAEGNKPVYFASILFQGRSCALSPQRLSSSRHMPIAVSIHTHSLHVQAFCLLFAVFLALIIAQIGGNVLCRNAFGVG